MTHMPTLQRIVSKAFGLLGNEPGSLKKALDAAAEFEDENHRSP